MLLINDHGYFLLNGGRLVINLIENGLRQVTNTVNLPGQPKVAYLDRAVLVQQNISRLKIPMNDFAILEVLNSMEQIPHDGLNVNHLESEAAFDQLLEVTLTVLEHHVYFFKILQVLRQDDVKQLDDARMLQLPQ